MSIVNLSILLKIIPQTSKHHVGPLMACIRVAKVAS
uniref:Uncharacterized protein n=1 Tax=Rhizophora mucronata TaxID=61149 RepID=A0A2P2PMJ6_RHIMU